MEKSNLLKLAEQLEKYQHEPQGYEWDKQLELFELIIQDINLQIAMFAPINSIFEYSVKSEKENER